MGAKMERPGEKRRCEDGQETEFQSELFYLDTLSAVSRYTANNIKKTAGPATRGGIPP
jgi:hypothetical protein